MDTYTCYTCVYVVFVFTKQLSPVTEIVYGSGLNEYNLYGTCEGGNGIYFDEETNKVAFTHQKWQMKNNPYVSQKMKVK